MPARFLKLRTKNTLSFTVLFATVFAFLLLSVMTPVAAAPGINGTINFQGKLQNPNGTNVTDGNYTVVFTLYDAASTGTTLWDETQTVTVTDGIFRVALGSVDTTLPSVNFNSDSLYLGMKVNADAEMTPRIRFTAVPYAFNAQKVNGLTVTNTSDAAFTSATTLKIADGKTLVFNNGLTFTGTDATSFTFPSSSGTIVTEDFTQTLTNKTIGSTGLVFSGATSDMTTPSGEHLALMPGGTGNVGIGTTDPSTFKLQVTGNVGPTTDSLYDLGSTGVRWANGYFDTLYGDGTNLTGIPTTNNIANSYVVSVSGGTYTAKSNSGLTDYSGTSLETVLESATSALSTAGGGRIQFKAGTFDFGTTNAAFNSVNDIVFEGEGIDATIIQNSSDAAADTEPLSFTNSKRITIRDLTVSAGGASRISSDAIDFDQGDDVLVERVKVTSSRGRGIVIDGKDTAATADRGIIRDCIITGTVDDGIELLGANQVTISGCKIYDVGGHGINLSKASPTAGQPNKQSNYNVIVGNDITNAGKDGINVNSGSHNKIIGNTVRNSADDTASRDGIRIDSFDSIACDYNIIEGNTSTDDQGVKTQRYGINITSANCNNNTLSNNTVDGNLTNSIVDSGTNTRYSQYHASSNILGMNTNIGIGTTSPVAKFQLTGAVTGKALAIFNETGDQDIFTASTSGTTRFTIKNNGNVGIGTTDPTKKLHLVGGLMQITNTGQLAGTVLERTDGSAGSLYAGLTFVAFQYDSSYGFAIRSNNRTDVLAGSGTNATTRLYVDGSGNVGIGSSTTLVEKFNVDGRIYLDDITAPVTTTNRLYSVSGNLYWNGTQLGSGGSSTWNSLTAPSGNLSLSMSTHTTGFNWATGTTTTDLFSLTTDASANGTGSLLNIQTGAGSTVLPLRVRAGATEALAVNASGNVGVGTTNPVYPMQIIVTAPDVADGRILDVDGDLTSITNDQSGFKVSPAVAPTANTSRAYSGGVFSTSGNSATRLTGATLRGFDAQSSYSGSGTLGTAVGGRYRILNTSTGTITNAYGLFIDAPSNTGTLTNTRGLYLASQAVGTQTNTAYGIYQEGADNYNYFAGNVGIGTSVPLAKLDIAGSASASGNLSFTGAATTVNQLNGGSLNFQTSVGGDAGLESRLYITNGGNVGIGTANPQDILHVNSPAPVLRIERNDTTVNAGEYLGRMEFYSMDDSTNLSGRVGSIDLVAATGFTSGATPPGANTSMLFKVNTGNAGNPSEAMRIQYDGNVGIGSTAPGTLLDVAGTMRASGVITLSNYTGNNAVLFGTTGTGVLSSATTSTSGLCLISGASTAYTPSWGSCSGSGGSTAWNAITAPAANLSLSMSTYTSAFNWATGTTTTDLFSLTTDASANGTGSLLNIQTGIGSTVIPLRVRAGSTEALYVKTDGNVGIGTTNPLGLFEVLGSSGAMRIGTGGNVLEFTRNSANYLWASGAAATFEFSVGGSDPFNDNRKMILTSAGRLGLNDFSPGAHLEISANGSTGDLLMLSSNDANNGDLFIVKNSGNVGIGTIDPTGGKLHVVGDAYITGALYLPGAASSASTTEGTIYYDTDDDQLKVYANGKWQSDRTSVTKIVAASNSQNKEKADYVADGTADNVEIQAAIDALPTGGGTVVLLEGTYNIATAISLTKDGAKVVGQGHSTLLTRTDAGSILNVVGTAIDRVTDVTIGHLRFSGPSVVGTQVSGDGILVDYTDRVSIEKVWASGFGSLSDDGAIMILRSTACTVKDSSLSGSKNGIVTGFATDAAGEVSHCTFSNNQVFSNYDDGIHTQHAKYITISDNHVYDNGTSGGDSAGIDTLGDSFDTITGNVVTGTTQKGIEIGNSTTAGVGDNNHTISGNTIYNNGQAGILMGNDAKYITISNNTSNGNGTYGILLGTSSTTKEVVDNVVIGNTFTGNTTDGIRLTGNAHRNLVKDNVVLSNGGRGMYIVFASTEYPEDNIVENNRFASNTGAQFQDGGIRSIVRFNIGTTADVEFANASSNPVIDMFTFSNASSGMTTTGLDGLQIDFATAGTTASTDNAGLRINVTSNNSGATTTLEGIYIGNLTSAEANATETGLKIGTGWDVGVAVESGGITVSGGTISYSSGNRQARKMVLSAEYPGAVLFGDGTNNTGSLTSDYTNSTTGSRTTYYEWTSSEASLQDYTIVVRFTLPDNFGAWAASSPMVFSYATESTTASNNQVDISVFLQSGASADATDVDNVSGTVGTWTTTSDITTASLSECDAAGETCVIEFSMQSLSDNYVRIGDITLNYMANF